jgi:hypothetical protein
MSRKWLTVLVIAGVLLAAQFVPVRRTNPVGGTEIAAPPDVAAILRRSCYNCHSDRTQWPWYSRVAPVSWFVANDVSEARDHLNFSRWGEYPADEKAHLTRRVVDEVTKGGMPLKTYLLMHRDAKLDSRDVEVLRAWAENEPAGSEQTPR